MVDQTGLGIVDIIGDKRAEILRLAEKFNAYNVRIFGSVARGEAVSTSDVDILVSFKPDYRLFDHIGLQQELEDLLGRRVEVIIDKNLREEFRPFIAKDVVPLT